MAGTYLAQSVRHHIQDNTSRHARFYRVGQRVQPVLDLAGLLADGIQRAGVAGGVLPAWPVREWVLVAEVVARGAAYLRHVCGLDKGRGEEKR
jgi:hypothetical protein